MSFNPDGTITCDKKGETLQNGGVYEALVVQDMDPDNPGHVRQFHFCRDREVDGVKVKGCANTVISAANLANYHEKRGTANVAGAPRGQRAGKSGSKSGKSKS